MNRFPCIYIERKKGTEICEIILERKGNTTLSACPYSITIIGWCPNETTAPMTVVMPVGKNQAVKFVSEKVSEKDIAVVRGI